MKTTSGLSPDQQADIKEAFVPVSKLLDEAELHPTAMTRGSKMVVHADGTSTHFSYSRRMTMSEYNAPGMTLSKIQNPTVRDRWTLWMRRFFN